MPLDPELDAVIDADLGFWKEEKAFERHEKRRRQDAGFVPILVLVIFALAAAFTAGAKVEQRVINQTMICHQPGG